MAHAVCPPDVVAVLANVVSGAGLTVNQLGSELASFALMAWPVCGVVAPKFANQNPELPMSNPVSL
jgi:hypothetical protein